MVKGKDLKEPKAVKLALGGKVWNLLLDLNAFVEIESVYGSIDEAMEAMEQGGLRAIRAMLWASMLHECPDLTEQAVGRWVTFGNMEEVSTALAEAIKIAMPEVSEEEMQKQQAIRAKEAERRAKREEKGLPPEDPTIN